MITTPTDKPVRKQKATASKAMRNEPGPQITKEEQAIQPDINSAALYRRAKEFSTDIQRGSVVEESQEKVDRIKAELANGTYKVDADAIAEKLMEFDFQIEDKLKPR